MNSREHCSPVLPFLRRGCGVSPSLGFERRVPSELVPRFLVTQSLHAEEILTVSFFAMMGVRPEERFHGLMEFSRGGWGLTGTKRAGLGDQAGDKCPEMCSGFLVTPSRGTGGCVFVSLPLFSSQVVQCAKGFLPVPPQAPCCLSFHPVGEGGLAGLLCGRTGQICER